MAMLSRVAEHLYWIARYLERVENTARLVSVNGSLILDLPRHARPSWSSIIAITGSQATFKTLYPDAAEGYVVKFMLADESNSCSILSSIRSARENARTIRDAIPPEAWERINDLYLQTRENLASGLSAKSRYPFLREVILGIEQIAGILDGGMSRDAGFEFMRLGFNLERADMTTRIIDVRASNLAQDQEALKPFENILWMSVLKSLTAYQMYRRHMQSAVKRDAVLRFLLQDREFPRSFRFCVGELSACLNRLPRNADVLKTLPPIFQFIDQSDPQALDQKELTQFIDELQISLGKIHSAISATYFAAEVTQSQSQR